MFAGPAPLQSNQDEQAHSNGWEDVIRTFLTDLAYTTRQPRSNPEFAIISVLYTRAGH
jgi:hypothetical protein